MKIIKIEVPSKRVTQLFLKKKKIKNNKLKKEQDPFPVSATATGLLQFTLVKNVQSLFSILHI